MFESVNHSPGRRASRGRILRTAAELKFMRHPRRSWQIAFDYGNLPYCMAYRHNVKQRVHPCRISLATDGRVPRSGGAPLASGADRTRVGGFESAGLRDVDRRRADRQAEATNLAFDLRGMRNARQVHAARWRDELDANHGTVGGVVDDPGVVHLHLANRGSRREREVRRVMLPVELDLHRFTCVIHTLTIVSSTRSTTISTRWASYTRFTTTYSPAPGARSHPSCSRPLCRPSRPAATISASHLLRGGDFSWPQVGLRLCVKNGW